MVGRYSIDGSVGVHGMASGRNMVLYGILEGYLHALLSI